MGSRRFDPEFDSDSNLLSELNVTPLIDIMLVLLIIFMVTSSLKRESAIEVDLPQTEQEGKSFTREKIIALSISKEKKVHLDGLAVNDSKQISSEIKKALQKKPQASFIFAVDKSLTFEDILPYVDLARGAGVKSFSIATEEKN